MSYRQATAALALVGMMALPTTSFAMTGIGCPDLPEYPRALGTIENGEGSCNMTMAEARRILAEHQAQESGQPIGGPPPVHRKRHRRVVQPQ